ncbi:MAG: 30S ribosomal protein S16 [SAR324 cluster bacterium]|nr:30S ribosomal protein S16 [SAR324 cluster bacterium]
MSVKIRLTRKGRKNSPFYRVIAIESRFTGDGRAIENLGTYNPLTKEANLKADRISEFQKKGAIISSAVARVMKRQGA